MLVNADMSEVTGNLPPGIYSARMTECEKKESKKGNTYLKWKGEVFDSETHNGSVFFHNTMIAGRGAFGLFDLYKAATGTELEKGSMELNTEQIIGQEIQVTLVESYDQQGNLSNFPEVKSITKL